MTVLIIGGHPELQQRVSDALEGRGRTAAVLPATPEDLDAVVAASEAVVYLHDDGHERRKPGRARGGRPQDVAAGSGWDAVAASVRTHKIPCVSAAKGARQGKGTITEIRLPEIYGMDVGLARSARGVGGSGPGNRPERVRGPQGRRVADPLVADIVMAPSLVDEWISTALFGGREIKIERDGSALVNAVLVDDLAEIVVDALVETETSGDVNKPVVLGDDQAVSMIDASLLVARIAFRYNGGREVKVASGKGTTRYIGHEHARSKGRGDVSTLEDIGWSVERLVPLESGVITVMERRMGR